MWQNQLMLLKITEENEMNLKGMQTHAFCKKCCEMSVVYVFDRTAYELNEV